MRVGVSRGPVDLDVVVKVEPSRVGQGGRTGEHRVLLGESRVELDVSLLGFLEQSRCRPEVDAVEDDVGGIERLVRDDFGPAEELVGDCLLLFALVEVGFEVGELALDPEVRTLASAPVGSAVVAVHVADEQRREIEPVLQTGGDRGEVVSVSFGPPSQKSATHLDRRERLAKLLGRWRRSREDLSLPDGETHVPTEQSGEEDWRTTRSAASEASCATL